MKMIKSLVLGAAAGMVAVAGANAADLPVKAKPVSYVKICPTYGPNFYYIPGTDICLRVGGLLLTEGGYNQRNANPFLSFSSTGGAFSAATQYTNFRTRAYLVLDARENTAYGTLRTFFFGGFEYVTGANGTNGIGAAFNAGFGGQGAVAQFAFIQFAGFTAGLATSFFDFAPGYTTTQVASNPIGWNNLIAYTANFGNGVSASISMEDPTNTNVCRTNTGAAAACATPAGVGAGTIGYERPDFIANVRVDQAWGSAQIMGAVKELRVGVGAIGLAGGRDDDGYAIGGGIEIKLPMIAPGDSIKFTAVYADGAIDYTGIGANPLTINNPSIGLTGVAAANNTGHVRITDADFSGGQVFRTEATSFSAQYRHFWTPTLRSAFHAGYNDAGNKSPTSFGQLQIHQYGTALIWSPAAGLNLSLDVIYSKTDVNNVNSDIVTGFYRITKGF